MDENFSNDVILKNIQNNNFKMEEWININSSYLTKLIVMI
jgi:hypothetical protein